MSNNVPKHKKFLADAGLFYAAAVWGATFFMVKDALAGIDPVTLVAYRFLIAGLIMLVFLIATKRPILKDLRRGTVLALLLWSLYIPQTIGLGYTTASNSGFITGLFVIFVPIFMRSVVNRRPTVREWIASGVALVGLWILTGGLTDFNFGDALTLIATVTYALHVLFSDRYMKGGMDPYIISCQQFLIIGLLSLLTGLIFGLDFGIHTTTAIWITLFLALFPTLSAFVIQMWAQRITTPVKVSLIFALEPVFAAIFAWTLGGEIPILHRTLGGLFVFAALVISGLPARSVHRR